jgi:hypothetical protein
MNQQFLARYNEFVYEGGEGGSRPDGGELEEEGACTLVGCWLLEEAVNCEFKGVKLVQNDSSRWPDGRSLLISLLN